MPTQLQLRRGTTSQNNSFTGAAGELSVDTDLDQLRVHDGSTAGGKSVPFSGSDLGVAGNSAPASGTLTLGTPANVAIRTHVASGAANVIIGDATITSGYNLDVRGTANTGAITATTITLSADGGVLVPNDGNIGSASTTDAMQIASGGIVTFKDDIKIKDDGTIGSASAATAMTIDSSGIVAFVDDIKIKDGGTIGVASAVDAMTVASTGIVTFKDDIIIKDGGTIGSVSDADAISISSGGVVDFSASHTTTIGGIKAANVAGTQGELVPSGIILAYGGATIPNGYLLCDGRAISRSTYSRLFTAVATGFGVGNGNNTFNIPKLDDALLMGKGANNSTLGTQTHAMPASSTKPSESTSIAAHSLTTATFATSAKDSSTSTAVTAVATHAAITPNMIFPTSVVNFVIKE